MKRFQWARAGRLTIAFGGILAASLVGCAGDNGALPRNNVQIEEVNNNSPLFADVYNNGPDLTKFTDDYIPTDAIPIKFVSNPADDALSLDPRKAFGTVQFTRYTVDFKVNDLDGDSTPDVNDIDAPMNVLVPAIGEALTAVLIVPAGVKGVGFLSTLKSGGEVFTSATLTFYGEELTSHNKVVLTTALIVGFANYADKKA